MYLYFVVDFFFFFSSRRRHTRSCLVSWARRCVQETVQIVLHKFIIIDFADQPTKNFLSPSKVEHVGQVCYISQQSLTKNGQIQHGQQARMNKAPAKIHDPVPTLGIAFVKIYLLHLGQDTYYDSLPKIIGANTIGGYQKAIQGYYYIVQGYYIAALMKQKLVLLLLFLLQQYNNNNNNPMYSALILSLIHI
eukprot:TRINITY_DN7927_c0_g1_i7.p2 TRINITY_DN7927_c0_g1~~TRINITY_DN7927_c0_g1_i7.p2  ORF type:complete len:192 (+),score=24.69 TRINITY_DN7927_c0_g1_i7:38-613(+)